MAGFETDRAKVPHWSDCLVGRKKKKEEKKKPVGQALECAYFLVTRDCFRVRTAIGHWKKEKACAGLTPFLTLLLNSVQNFLYRLSQQMNYKSFRLLIIIVIINIIISILINVSSQKGIEKPTKFMIFLLKWSTENLAKLMSNFRDLRMCKTIFPFYKHRLQHPSNPT